MKNKPDFRDIKKLNKDGTFTIIKVDWNKNNMKYTRN